MENMTQAPFVIRGLRNGLKLGGGALEDSLMAGLTDSYCGLPMALTAEKLAEQHGITRKDADSYALRSQQAADAAYKACRMKEELVAVEVKQGKKSIVVSQDDHRRPDTTMEILEKLPPSFKKDGVVTAQYLAVEKILGLKRDKTNVNGGAIALGHPLGASGTRLVITILNELRRNHLRYGLATACIGGGQGIAMVLEALHN